MSTRKDIQIDDGRQRLIFQHCARIEWTLDNRLSKRAFTKSLSIVSTVPLKMLSVCTARTPAVVEDRERAEMGHDS